MVCNYYYIKCGNELKTSHKATWCSSTKCELVPWVFGDMQTRRRLWTARSARHFNGYREESWYANLIEIVHTHWMIFSVTFMKRFHLSRSMNWLKCQPSSGYFATDGQSASRPDLVSGSHLGPKVRLLLLSDIWGLHVMGAFLDERTDL
jgi:hypothetical protein